MDITSLVTNPENITFALLFVYLLWYTNKRNDARELKSEEREAKYQEIIAQQSKAILAMDEIKNKVEVIHEELVKSRNT